VNLTPHPLKIKTMKFTGLLPHITPHRATLLQIVALLIANSLATLAQPWIAGRLTAAVLDDNGLQADVIQMILLGWLGLVGIKSALGFGSSYLVGTTGARMAARLRKRVYEHMQLLPLPYFHARSPGESLSLLGNDAQVIGQFVTTTLVTLLPLLLTFFGAFILMWLLDVQIALVVVILLLVYFFAMKVLGRRIRPVAREWIRSWSRLYTLAQENLGLLPIIKSFNREPVESQRFTARNDKLRDHSSRQVLVQSIMSPAVSFLASVGLLLVLWLGISRVESHDIDTASLVSLLLYSMLLTRPISGLANVYGQVQNTRGAAERLVSFFSEPAEPAGKNLPGLNVKRGHIQFENVSFAYPGRKPVLMNFDLKIQPGETIALTGPNGAGKSTLAHLLMRFITPGEGKISIDGKDIAKHELSSIRNAIGLVAQRTLLLNASVAENIAYGNIEADQADIEKVARATGSHEFILQMPNGYDTIIGDQGVRLSGGQRQRLSLARTLLAGPPILILDEATAMFDPLGEEDFIDQCSVLLEEKTVILISHHSAIVTLADRVVSIEDADTVPE